MWQVLLKGKSIALNYNKNNCLKRQQCSELSIGPSTTLLKHKTDFIHCAAIIYKKTISIEP